MPSLPIAPHSCHFFISGSNFLLSGRWSLVPDHFFCIHPAFSTRDRRLRCDLSARDRMLAICDSQLLSDSTLPPYLAFPNMSGSSSTTSKDRRVPQPQSHPNFAVRQMLKGPRCCL